MRVYIQGLFLKFNKSLALFPQPTGQLIIQLVE